MDLTPEQKEKVATWVSDGASIADVQKRLNDEFQLGLTYMEARFLIDDLELELKDAEKPVETPDFSKPEAPSSQTPPPASQTAGDEAYDLEPEASGAVTVEVDKLTRPGAVVSGTVVFSDGVKATWLLDQSGRLALDAGTPGYQPGPEDIEAFQQELSQQLQKQGF